MYRIIIKIYIFFEFNYINYLHILLKNNINSYFNFKLTNKLAIKLQSSIYVYKKNDSI